MNILKLAGASAAFALTACTQVSSDVAYCERTGDTSFEIKSVLTPSAPTTLYTAKITRIYPTDGIMYGYAIPTEINGLHPKNFSPNMMESASSFSVALKNETCVVSRIIKYQLHPQSPAPTLSN